MDNKIVYNKVTIASLLVALGIIYGDIGTSPLYVLSAIVGERKIDEVLVFGGVCLIFWTLFFQTTIKYVWLTLRADNHGEGGVFSLFALVKRYSKSLAIITILGATTLLADGIITPPISVSSAIEGLSTVNGLEKGITRYNQMLQQQIHFLHCGHFHNDWQLSFNMSQILINGSFIGTSNFSATQMVASSPPIQVLHVFEPRIGLAKTERIYLNEGDIKRPIMAKSLARKQANKAS